MPSPKSRLGANKSFFSRRRASLADSKVTIAVPWTWTAKVLATLSLVCVSAAAGIWGYVQSREFAGVTVDDARRQLVDYRNELARVTAERDELSATTNSAGSELNIERAAQRQLLLQVQQLEAENARLKEDLSFFDSLLPAAAGPKGIAIRRLKIDQVAPNQLRYRVLIMQGGKSDFFSGVLQLAINTSSDGGAGTLIFPAEGASESGRFKLGFRHYQRLEGIVDLPDGVTPVSVIARVISNGQTRAQTSVNL